eukprot:1152209-Pelagomonas_calceolata.AAC.5
MRYSDWAGSTRSRSLTGACTWSTGMLLQLRAGLNEKELELIELREQHVQLAARSQEARTNWEAALTSKVSGPFCPVLQFKQRFGPTLTPHKAAAPCAFPALYASPMQDMTAPMQKQSFRFMFRMAGSSMLIA